MERGPFGPPLFSDLLPGLILGPAVGAIALTMLGIATIACFV